MKKIGSRLKYAEICHIHDFEKWEKCGNIGGSLVPVIEGGVTSGQRCPPWPASSVLTVRDPPDANGPKRCACPVTKNWSCDQPCRRAHRPRYNHVTDEHVRRSSEGFRVCEPRSHALQNSTEQILNALHIMKHRVYGKQATLWLTNAC